MSLKSAINSAIYRNLGCEGNVKIAISYRIKGLDSLKFHITLPFAIRRNVEIWKKKSSQHYLMNTKYYQPIQSWVMYFWTRI